MKPADKTIRHNYAGRSYTVKIYAKDNCAYIFDDSYSEPVFKMSPVNDKSLIEIGYMARKGATYLTGLERDYVKLREQGFEFLGPVAHFKPAPAPKPKQEKKVDRGALPMWMRYKDE